MLNVCLEQKITQYKPSFKSKGDYSQIYKDMQNVFLKQDEKIKPKVNINNTFSTIKQSAKNNIPSFNFHIPDEIKDFLKMLGIIILGISTFLCTSALAIGACETMYFVLNKVNDMFKSTNKETQIIKQKSVSASKEDKTSLQIDSLNNLYKNKTITLDEFIKGVNKIGRKNK